jgi:hypothetical protein
MDVAPDDGFLDCAAWRAWLEREVLPSAAAWVGVLRRDEFARGRGKLLVWQTGEDGVRVALREYRGAVAADVALLLVADNAALGELLAHGAARIRPLVRRGRLHPYMLKTLDELGDVGLADFVEDLGLVFPRH